MNVLAIGAHPDDIEFGCAGTLMKYSDNGHNVYSLVLTGGDQGGSKSTRQREAEEAARKMGVKEILWKSYRDTELSLNKPLINDIEQAIGVVQPSFIFVHHKDDTHQDHRALAQAAISATRYIRKRTLLRGSNLGGLQPQCVRGYQRPCRPKNGRPRRPCLTVGEDQHPGAQHRGHCSSGGGLARYPSAHRLCGGILSRSGSLSM